jgi:arylsulfatase A-like enzyme
MKNKAVLFLIFILYIFHLGTAMAQDRPNILFIMTDDHTQQALHAYGQGLLDTVYFPNMNRLAKEGALFRNSFVTNSICAPSRAVLLTGNT